MTSSREQKASTRMIISAVQPFALGNTDEVFGFCWGGGGGSWKHSSRNTKKSHQTIKQSHVLSLQIVIFPPGRSKRRTS
jgi:hypothetical protein